MLKRDVAGSSFSEQQKQREIQRWDDAVNSRNFDLLAELVGGEGEKPKDGKAKSSGGASEQPASLEDIAH